MSGEFCFGRVARSAFLTPHFTTLAFLEAVRVKKICWPFFSFEYLAFLEAVDTVTHTIRLVFCLFEYLNLAEEYYNYCRLFSFFRQCLVYFKFMKIYLKTHKIIKL